jgi:hypothetical protein
MSAKDHPNNAPGMPMLFRPCLDRLQMTYMNPGVRRLAPHLPPLSAGSAHHNPRVVPAGATGEPLPFVARLGGRGMGVFVADIARYPGRPQKSARWAAQPLSGPGGCTSSPGEPSIRAGRGALRPD